MLNAGNTNQGSSLDKRKEKRENRSENATTCICSKGPNQFPISSRQCLNEGNTNQPST